MAAKNKSEAGENPLVPNAKLRALYTTMLEARALETSLRDRSKGKKKPASIRGQEAVRASAILQLIAEDLVSDIEPSIGMGLMLGADPRSLLSSFSPTNKKLIAIPRLLSSSIPAAHRLEMALGAALALKAQNRQGVVIAFAYKNDLSLAAFLRLLRSAAAGQLPIIFILLPRTTGRRALDGHATISRASSKSGVPGIPVDAADSVAIYRVLQESLGRTRGGDGPVLVECIPWAARRLKAMNSIEDPIEHLRSFLLARKISSPSQLKRTESSALRRLRGNRYAS